MRKRPRRLDTSADESPTCDDLTREQQSELVRGPYGESAFDSDEHRELEWRRHKHVILHSSTHGVWGGPYTDRDRRPWAWWRYEYLGDGPPDKYDEERYPWPWDEEAVELRHLGELSPRCELLLWTRAEDRWRGALESLKGRPEWRRTVQKKPPPYGYTADEKEQIARLERVLQHVESGIKAAKARRG